MIELIKIPQKFPGDIINDVKSGKIHVVCMGQNGLTHLNIYAELCYSIPKNVVNHCVDLVNSKKETGTLYPQAYISILPISDGKEKLDYKELENCIYDVFIANQKYLKSEIIYFSLESYYINKENALAIIERKIAVEIYNDLYVKTIWFEG